MVYVKPFIFSFPQQLSVAFFSLLCQPTQMEEASVARGWQKYIFLLKEALKRFFKEGKQGFYKRGDN